MSWKMGSRTGYAIGVSFLASFACVLAQPADAAITISAKSTRNVDCSNGVCTATAKNAVLNVSDVTAMLASGNLAIQSGNKAEDIQVEAPFSWTADTSLTLDAHRSILIHKPVLVAGPGGLNIMTDGALGNFYFGRKGSVNFLGTSNPLTINGQSYMLVSDIASLANAIAANPAENYALAHDYDARSDGTYTSSPIQTTFTGNFEGLGNTVSHLSAKNRRNDPTGFFATIVAGTIQNFSLSHIRITIYGKAREVGGIAGANAGTFVNDHVSGTIRSTAENAGIGGLAGYNGGLIDRSSASAQIIGAGGARAGGLAGANTASIRESFSTGTVIGGDSSRVGGLVGDNLFSNSGFGIKDSYALASASGGAASQAGGFVGRQEATDGEIATSFSIGAVLGGESSLTGGFGGVVHKSTSIAECYWDTTTSGTTQAVGERETAAASRA
jgi:hypothetical protein